MELYLIVFVCRYLDLFTSFHSLYNTTMKILYIAVSAGVVVLMRFVSPYKESYRKDAKNDNFQHHLFAVLPCAVLAMVFNEGNWTPWHNVQHYSFEVGRSVATLEDGVFLTR